MLRDDTVRELKSIYATLQADVYEAQELYKASGNQFARRVLVRAFFSFIEGLAYNLRQVTLASCKGLPNVSAAELFLLQEETCEIDEKGKVRPPREKYLATGSAFLFSLRMYPKAHGGQYNPELGDGGWEAFRNALALRDSITHPKSAAKLEISDEALVNFAKASEWGKSAIRGMFDACDEADRQVERTLQTSEQ
jgi:hypothetical protein